MPVFLLLLLLCSVTQVVLVDLDDGVHAVVRVIEVQVGATVRILLVELYQQYCVLERHTFDLRTFLLLCSNL